jgi:hypothetical protein
MDILKQIEKAIPIFVENSKKPTNKEFDEYAEDVIKDLVDAGMSNLLAEKIFTFMPLAFGRVFMNDLNIEFQQEYDLFTFENHRPVTKEIRQLSGEIIFIESLKLAKEAVSNKVFNENYQLIAFTSAEFNVVNKLLSEGSESGNIVLTKPMIPWSEQNQNDIYYQKLSSEQIKNEITKDSSLKSEKSWWQFWK